NFLSYVNKLRLDKAKELLATTEYTMGEIAEKVGYNNSAIFINNFKKQFYITPGNYRLQQKHMTSK
ncbi:MAG: helix-turn-helix transcriptional regulator, partial [Candidatus Merdivicinus sp.]